MTTSSKILKLAQRTMALLQTALEVGRERRGNWKCSRGRGCGSGATRLSASLLSLSMCTPPSATCSRTTVSTLRSSMLVRLRLRLNLRHQRQCVVCVCVSARVGGAGVRGHSVVKSCVVGMALSGGSGSGDNPVVPPATAPTAAKAAAAEDATLDGDEEMPAAKINMEDSDDDSWLG